MAEYKGIRGFTIQNLSADPPAPIVGQVWYNTTSTVLKGFGQLSSDGESLVTHKCECVAEFLSLSFEKLSDAEVWVLNEGLL